MRVATTDIYFTLDRHVGHELVLLKDDTNEIALYCMTCKEPVFIKQKPAPKPAPTQHWSV